MEQTLEKNFGDKLIDLKKSIQAKLKSDLTIIRSTSTKTLMPYSMKEIENILNFLDQTFYLYQFLTLNQQEFEMKKSYLQSISNKLDEFTQALITQIQYNFQGQDSQKENQATQQNLSHMCQKLKEIFFLQDFSKEIQLTLENMRGIEEIENNWDKKYLQLEKAIQAFKSNNSKEAEELAKQYKNQLLLGLFSSQKSKEFNLKQILSNKTIEEGQFCILFDELQQKFIRMNKFSLKKTSKNKLSLEQIVDFFNKQYCNPLIRNEITNLIPNCSQLELEVLETADESVLPTGVKRLITINGLKEQDKCLEKAWPEIVRFGRKVKNPKDVEFFLPSDSSTIHSKQFMIKFDYASGFTVNCNAEEWLTLYMVCFPQPIVEKQIIYITHAISLIVSEITIPLKKPNPQSKIIQNSNDSESQETTKQESFQINKKQQFRNQVQISNPSKANNLPDETTTLGSFPQNFEVHQQQNNVYDEETLIGTSISLELNSLNNGFAFVEKKSWTFKLNSLKNKNYQISIGTKKDCDIYFEVKENQQSELIQYGIEPNKIYLILEFQSGNWLVRDPNYVKDKYCTCKVGIAFKNIDQHLQSLPSGFHPLTNENNIISCGRSLKTKLRFSKLLE
eukprot:TRINITY_DN2622_c0_g1_i1.p1 TRINITY_DN2622_c0_g1~~TRINITY_DN2622_c0_g1_i1.p1  ORF type:complete len:620 (+),score=96.57 TRINITY_DN2622_c0_g1_i1:206-2065(+)